MAYYHFGHFFEEGLLLESPVTWVEIIISAIVQYAPLLRFPFCHNMGPERNILFTPIQAEKAKTKHNAFVFQNIPYMFLMSLNP